MNADTLRRALDEAPDILCIGTVSCDYIAVVDRLPERDERIETTDLRTTIGGPALVAAATLANLGNSVTLIGAIGDDREADYLEHEVTRLGLQDVRLRRVSGARSHSSLITVERQDGSRAIIHRAGPDIDLRSATEHRLLRAASWVHTDHYGYAGLAAAVTPIAREQRPAISIDAGYPIPDLDLGIVSLYAPTEGAARQRYAGSSTAAALRTACDEGADIAVATRGSRGSIGYSRSDGAVEQPPYELDAVSTLGAGDVFHGALLDSVVRGLPLQDALRRANAAAAHSCLAIEALAALPTEADLRDLLDDSAQRHRSTGHNEKLEVPHHG